MSKELADALAARIGRTVTLMPCRIMQTSPLLVSFDGGSTSVPGQTVTGCTYGTSSVNNAVALMQSPSTPIILRIG